MEKKPNDYQPGGKHYEVQKGIDQHWDFMDRWDVGCLEYAATKYIERIGKGKGTDLLDCQKARHYVEKILHEHTTNGRPPRRYVPDRPIAKYAREHKLNGRQVVFYNKLLQWRTAADLQTVIAVTEQIEKELRAQPADSEERRIDNTGQKHPFGFAADEE